MFFQNEVEDVGPKFVVYRKKSHVVHIFYLCRFITGFKEVDLGNITPFP